MNGQIAWGELFFTATGRLSRTPFLIASAILFTVGAIYEASVGATLHWLTGWFIYPALIYCGACVLSKRLHDRGRTGWFAALILFSLAALWQQAGGLFGAAFAVVMIWAVVELGVMPGELGANRFGVNPLRPLAA
ncbi:DUF805 domain-containing protein [Phenylobacterium aquaticum]|uniref:DUF805 domain-containing protein n=1 Tax=Phenylobacterium aquaticum TaxID=1763816 RepID=UPI0026EE05F6|nr:DUF805 domain-containing protein [Phenylobacterium aquaticum]